MKHIYLKKLISVKNQQLFLVLVAVFLLNLINPINAQNRDEAPFSKYAPSDELVSIRNRNTKQFKNPDGSISAFVGSGPIHFFNGAGWQDINTSILHKDGNDYNYYNESNSFFNYFPNNPFTNPVKYSYNNTVFEETVVSIDFIDANGILISSLPLNLNNVNVAVNGNKITYSNFHNDLDLVYTLENTRRKFDLIVKTANFINQIPSNAEKISIREKVVVNNDFKTKTGEDGISIFVNGENILTYPTPVAYDSDVEHEFNAKNATITSEVNESSNSMSIYSLFDVAWLKSNNRVFPIKLDPIANFLPTLGAGNFWTGYQTSSTAKTSGFLRITGNTTASWAKYNISGIPVGSTIASITYWGNHYTGTNTTIKYCNIRQMTSDPVPATAATIWAASTTGALYSSGTGLLFAAANTFGWKSHILNATANTYMQTNLASGWFAIGMNWLSGNTSFGYHYGSESTAGNCTYLSINYTTPACSGTPTGGTAAISVASGCASQPFTLSATGMTGLLSGISYQWQSAPSSTGPWTNIGGATATTTLISTGAPATTFYRMLTTCANSALSGTSTVVSYNVNLSGPCSCANYPTAYAALTTNEEITNVTVGTLNNTSFCGTTAPGPGSIAYRYSNYTNFVAAPSFAQGAAVPFSLTQTTCNSLLGNGFQIYIDFNQNGSFADAGEQVYTQPVAATGNHTKTGTINIPVSALAGTTRMRVVNVEATFPNATNYAQLNYNYGETEDYCVTITPAVNCSGTPNAGTAAISSSVGCSNTSFNLSATNITGGLGITYQWQSSTSSTGPWSDITGATAASTLISTGVAATTYFQLVTTCTVSALSNTSSVISYSVNSAGACLCAVYSANYASSTADEEITNVTVGTLNNTSACNVTAPGPGSIANRYSNFTSSVAAPNFNQGSSISFSLTQTTCGGAFGNFFQIYIDYNQNGSFADAGELVYVQPTAVTGNHTATGNFVVPMTALAGSTRMRVVNIEGGSSTALYGQNVAYTWGETEDYCVTIIATPVCSGQPNAGTAAISTSVGCPSSTFTLSATGTSFGPGITYQWQSSASSTGPWANITGATSATLATNTATTAYYQLVTTCTNSAQSNTSSVISYSAVYTPCSCLLYGASNATSTFYEEIFNVSLGTLNNTSNCTQTGGPGSLLQRYNNYTGGLVAAPTLTQGSTYTFSVTVGNCNASAFTGYVRIFMDFNQNGLFTDVGESVYTSALTTFAAAGTIVSSSIVIPLNATLGTTRMRVIAAETTVPNPTGTYTYGETEDYCVNIVVAPTCSGAPSGGTSSASSASVCPATNFTITNANQTGALGISYQWQSGPSTSGPWTLIGAPTSTYGPLVTTQTVNTYYSLITTCTVSALSASSTPVLVSTLSGTCQCAAYPAFYATSDFDEEITNVTVGTMNNSSNCTTTAPGIGSILKRYSNYTGFVTGPSVTQGNSVNFSLSQVTCNGNYGNIFQIWVDWNQDGDFLDAGEGVYNQPTAVTGNNTIAGSFIVPANAVAGTTRMRVVNIESGATTVNYAHSNYTWGETEDYCFTVIPTLPCSGTPTTGVAAITTSAGCPNGSFNLTASGVTAGSGITYQWQSSASSTGPWTAITNATNTAFTTTAAATTYYQLVTTCTVSGLTNTTSVISYSVVNNPCLCSTYVTAANNCGIDYISNVKFASINRTSTCDTYSAYGSPNPAITLGQTYSISVTTGGDTEGIGAWIDYNNDGVFSNASELVLGLSYLGTNPATYTANILIPMTATVGTVRLRVRCNYAAAPVDASSAQTWGETEDYCITLVCGNPTITATSSSSLICIGSSASLTASGSNSYTWNPGALTGSVVVVNPSSTTVYTVSGVNANGCSNTATLGLTVDNPTVNAVSIPTAICIGGTATLTASGVSTYTWNPGALVGANVTVNPSSTSIYTVSGTSANGCAASNTISLSVNSLPVIVPVATPTAICLGSSGTLSATGANTYTWSPGNLIGSSVSASPTVITTYTVTGTDANGCVNASTVDLFVNSLPTISSSSNPLLLCYGSTATLTAGGANTYTWNPGSLIGSPVNDSPLISTVYTVTGTDNNGCSGTSTISVAVSTTVTALASPSAICAGGSSTLTGNNATTYTWDPGSLPGSSIVVGPSSSTTYTLNGTDANGCVSSATINVTIDQTPTVTPVANPVIICSGGLVNLTATGAASYTWNPGSLVGSSVNDSPSSSTVYSVTGASAAGCLAASAQTVLVTVGGTSTTTVNFYEGFEGIVYNDQLPNCSWLSTSPGVACKTYTFSDPATNRVPSSGNNFGCFQAPTAAGGDYFFSNAVQLTAGAVYSTTIKYVTSPGSNWSKFGLMYNNSQSPRGGGLGSQNSLMAATTITVITSGLTSSLPHAEVGATFSVPVTGLYYISIFAEGTTGFLSFDDKNTTMYSNLPIELVSFSATKYSDVVKLDWRTQSELNSEKFIIEKSLDAVKWDFVAETNAAGNSTTIQDYTTYDNNPYYGISYYRLLQQDIDKTMHNYGIRTVNFSRDRVSEIMLMPNPTSGNVNFDYYSQYKGSLIFKVSDVAGKVVIPETNTGDIIDNKKSGTIYLNEFKPGVYFVEFNCNNLKTVKKIIKQ